MRGRPDICIIKGLSVGVKAAIELTASKKASGPFQSWVSMEISLQKRAILRTSKDRPGRLGLGKVSVGESFSQ